MRLTTAELQPGQQVSLLDFGQTEPTYMRRLLALGLTPGTCIRVVRRAPLGCPIQLDVRGVALIVRAQELAHLHWEDC
jgi:ferrous iron transport protein A